MDTEKLVEQFSKIYPNLSGSAILKIVALGSLKTIPKKSRFIEEGKLDQRIAFVIEGIFRGFINQDGEEITLWFSTENDLIASYNGPLLNAPSKITYQALEESTIFIFEYSKLKELARQDLEIAFYIIEMQEKILIESLHRNERFMLMDAEERYQNLINNKPDIVQRVSQKLLASYIGITPVSLSRLRARLNKK